MIAMVDAPHTGAAKGGAQRRGLLPNLAKILLSPPFISEMNQLDGDLFPGRGVFPWNGKVRAAGAEAAARPAAASTEMAP
jgi:hypothetical protein